MIKSHTGCRFLDGIDHVDAPEWDGLIRDGDPFTRHSFLKAMEKSGSAGDRTGWQPLHVVLQEQGKLAAAAPLYGKSNSWGEYVFDHSWADACERAGGRYYPKLQCAVPFTPVPGNRLLARNEQVRDRLIDGMIDLWHNTNASSIHVTFCTGNEAEALQRKGFLLRRGIQYHWQNQDYACFDDFLAALKSSRRKMIRKERRAIADAGIEIRTASGREAVDELLDGFYPFYLATVDKRWGSAYLTKAFFKLLSRTMGDQVVMVAAYREGELVAAAMNLKGPETLYGRLWGCLEDYRFLHFECCYYQAIDYAIEHGLKRVEAGAQGTHKLHRGYEPVWTHSAHKLRDPGLSSAIERFLRSETRQLEHHIDELRSMLPYRSDHEDL